MQQLLLFDLIEEDVADTEEEAQEARKCTLACMAAGCIDARTGLHAHPLIVDHPVDIRWRNRLIELAELQGWPQLSFTVARQAYVIGPGRTIWHRYYTRGGDGMVADIVGALERRQRGEPEREQCTTEEDEEEC